MTADFLLNISLMGWFALAFFYSLRGSRKTGLAMIGFGLVGSIVLWRFGLLHFVWEPTPSARGESSTSLLVGLYLSMVAGMLSHFAYDRFQRLRRHRKKFDWGVMLAPLFASPLVFLPLVIAFDQAGAALQGASSSRIAVLIVAFENGFFWREFVENRWKSKTKTEL